MPVHPTGAAQGSQFLEDLASGVILTSGQRPRKESTWQKQ